MIPTQLQEDANRRRNMRRTLRKHVPSHFHRDLIGMEEPELEDTLEWVSYYRWSTFRTAFAYGFLSATTIGMIAWVISTM